MKFNYQTPTVLTHDRENFPSSSLPQTQMYSHTKLYATDLVDLEYCPRLFKISR